MTKEQLKAMRERLEYASPPSHYWVQIYRDMEALLAEVERLQKVEARLSQIGDVYHD